MAIWLLLLGLSLFAQSPAAPTPYDAEFAALRQRFERLDKPELVGDPSSADAYRAVLLDCAFELRIYLSDRSQLISWLKTVQAGPSPLLAEEARRLLREIERAQGDIAMPPLPRSPRLLALADDTSESLKAGNCVPEALYAAGSLQRAAGRAEAVGMLERYARCVRRAAAWVEYSRACRDQLCRFSALRQALAAEPGDREATLEFAAYYGDRGQDERERELLESLLTRFPMDFVARKMLADRLLREGQEQAALAEFERLEKEFGGVLWVAREVAAGYERLQLPRRALPLATRAFNSNRPGKAEQDLILRLASTTHETATLRSALESITRLNPSDTAALAQLARLRWRQGERSAARETLQRAMAANPGDRNLTSAAAQLELAAGNAAALAALAANGDANLAKLAAWHRQARPADPDAEWLAEPARVAAAAASAVKHPNEPEFAGGPVLGEPAVLLSDIRIDRVGDQGLTVSRVQQFWRVGTAAAAGEFSNRTVQYSPESQTLEILAARLHKPDGRALEAEDVGESAVGDRRAAMYYDQRRRQLHYAGCEAGDIVELDFRTSPRSAANPYGDYFAALVVFSGSIPVAHKRYVLITSPERQPKIVEQRMVPGTVRHYPDQRQLVYEWNGYHLPRRMVEPHGPSVTDSSPYVHVSSIGDWREFGRWYAGLLNPQLTSDEPLHEAAARIAAEHAGELERIRAVHQFVLRNTHYVALEFGVHSYQPYPVSQVYARRFGDCKDTAAMMVAMLRSMGVEAQFALVRTRQLGGVDPRAASVALFNHAMIYVPKYELWLDGTAEDSGVGELPLDDQGALALTVGLSGEARLRQVPVSTAEQNSETDTIRAAILDDGSIRFTGTATARGEGAGARSGVRESQRESLRRSYAELFPTVRVESVRVQQAGSERGVTVEFQAAVDARGRRPWITLPASWSRADYVQQLAELPERTQDLVFAAPWERTQEIRVTLPAKARVLAAPAAREQQTRFGKLTLECRQSGRELTLRSTVALTATRIPPSDYAEFRSFWGEVDRALRQELKVTLE